MTLSHVREWTDEMNDLKNTHHSNLLVFCDFGADIQLLQLVVY